MSFLYLLEVMLRLKKLSTIQGLSKLNDINRKQVSQSIKRRRRSSESLMTIRNFIKAFLGVNRSVDDSLPSREYFSLRRTEITLTRYRKWLMNRIYVSTLKLMFWRFSLFLSLVLISSVHELELNW